MAAYAAAAVVELDVVRRQRPAASRVDEVVVAPAIECGAEDEAVSTGFLDNAGPHPRDEGAAFRRSPAILDDDDASALHRVAEELGARGKVLGPEPLRLAHGTDVSRWQPQLVAVEAEAARQDVEAVLPAALVPERGAQLGQIERGREGIGREREHLVVRRVSTEPIRGRREREREGVVRMAIALEDDSCVGLPSRKCAREGLDVVLQRIPVLEAVLHRESELDLLERERRCEDLVVSGVREAVGRAGSGEVMVHLPFRLRPGPALSGRKEGFRCLLLRVG